MVRAQVQIPEKLHREVKRLADERGWSFAEVVRRGLEHMMRTHLAVESRTPDLPILPARVFADGFDQVDLRALVEADEISESS